MSDVSPLRLVMTDVYNVCHSEPKCFN